MTIQISKRIAEMENNQLMEAINLVNTHGSYRKAEKASGMTYGEIERRHKEAARRGLLGFKPVLPGFHITQTTETPSGEHFVQQKPEPGPKFEMPTGHMAKGVSVLLDQDGKIKQSWVKTKLNDINVDWSEVFKNAFKEHEGRSKPVKLTKRPQSEFLTLIPCNDWHINMMAWSREVGENWDIKIAEKTIGAAITEAILRTKPARIGVVLGGGDLMHNDDNTNRTAKSSAVLDCDGRFQKGIEAAQRLKILTIDTALQNHDKIIVRILKGNHDEYSSIAIGYFLAAWYRNEPRVEVDLDASLFWWYRFGRVLLGATHGHTVRVSQMPSIMAHRRAEDWGATKFRYVHGFHIHHKEKIATEGEGVICETHQAPIPMDAWHWGSGFLSGRSVQTITYHKDYGESGRIREAILDV